MFLLDSLLLAPLKGVAWMGQKLSDMAQKELCDEGRIKEELMRLQLQLEMDEITEEQYDRREEELLDRLDALVDADEKET
ncbi:MAG: gas vesicle protein GvpG [Sedimentisphaerales bacterium]